MRTHTHTHTHLHSPTCLIVRLPPSHGDFDCLHPANKSYVVAEYDWPLPGSMKALDASSPYCERKHGSHSSSRPLPLHVAFACGRQRFPTALCACVCSGSLPLVAFFNAPFILETELCFASVLGFHMCWPDWTTYLTYQRLIKYIPS